MKRSNDIAENAEDDFYVKPCSQIKKGDWLVGILGLSGEALPLIREEVWVMKKECVLERGDRSKLDISYEVSSKLIKRSAIKAGAFGGLTSAPAALPVIGTIGTAVVGAFADLAYLLRTQIELCYSISVAYDSGIDEDEIKAVTLALLGFSGSAQMVKGIAASTFKNMVDATAAKYINKGIAYAAEDVTRKISPRFFGRAYKLIPLISIPLSASINIASTMMVGNQARNYFSVGDVIVKI
ncbi:MAG TPA: hypothetical protein VMW78_01990 [Anaerolineae bacterium]|nr:hypothetical protein [Anaerolineae bacterium]